MVKDKKNITGEVIFGKLENGSKLAVVPLKHSYSAATMALIKAGPRYDPPKKEGLSHFVEHMLFKGTKKWPSSVKLTSVLEKKGASAYAFSYHETNKYWVLSGFDDINLAIENLLERIHHPLLKTADMETEKGVVKEERRIVISNTEKYIWELWSQTLWKNSTLGRVYIGTEKSVDSFSANDIRQFKNGYYLPENIVYAVSGKVDMKSVSDKFNKYLERLPNSSKVSKIRDEETAPSTNNIRVIHRDAENISVAIGFPTVNYLHKDKPALELIGKILAGGMSSRLRQKVMEPGYTYSIEAYAENLSDTGYLVIMFTTIKKHLRKCLNIIYQEFESLASKPVATRELNIAKGYYSGLLKINTETSFDWASFYTKQLFYDPTDVVSLQEFIARTGSVGTRAIQVTSRKYFNPRNLCIAAIGNVKEENIPLFS